jgi:hypothetical protein
MKYTKETITGSFLREFGISSKTLEHTRIILVRYIPFTAFTWPSIFGNPVVFISEKKLKFNK